MTTRLLLTADAVGGVWQYATDLAHALAPLGVEAVLAVLGPAPSPAQRAAAAGLQVIDTGLPLDWLCDGPEPVLAAGRALADLAAAERADLVQLNSPALGAAALFPCPVVAVEHGCVATWWAETRGTPLATEFGWHRDLSRQGLLAADRTVAPTAAHAAAVARAYHVPRPAVVLNGRDDPFFPTGATGGPVRALFTAGRLWDEAKDTALLDRVASRLDAPFAAAGALAGPNGERVDPRHLRAAGALNRAGMVKRMSERPVFVSAARFEPFGLAVLEAAQAGCALVLSDIGSFRELWNDAAVFVRPGDEDGFVAAVEMLLGDPDRRAALGRAARDRSEHFPPGRTSAGMVRLFAELLRPGALSSPVVFDKDNPEWTERDFERARTFEAAPERVARLLVTTGEGGR